MKLDPINKLDDKAKPIPMRNSLEICTWSELGSGRIVFLEICLVATAAAATAGVALSVKISSIEFSTEFILQEEIEIVNDQECY